MTYNIHGVYLTGDQKHALKQHLQRLKAPMCVVMDDLHLAIEIKALLPNCEVIFRRYMPDDNAHLSMTPQQWLSSYADVPTNLTLYNNNEPGINQALFDWTLECAKLTISAGRKACLLNLSVGVPEAADWNKADALLRCVAQHRDRLLIGLHEYSPSLWAYEFSGGSAILPASWPTKIPGSSWLLGRYRVLLEHCRAKGIPTPRIAITEHGWDYIHAAASWQDGLQHRGDCESAGAFWCNMPQWDSWAQGAGMSSERYAYLQIQAGWDALYRYDPEIVGFALFCYGGQGRWAWYDSKDAHEFTALMEQGNWAKINTTPPIDPPQPAPQDGVFKYLMNVRTQPTTSAPKMGSIPAGTPAPLPPLIKSGNYIWIATGGGYVAVLQLDTGESYVRA